MELFSTLNLWASDLEIDFLRLWAGADSLASLTFVVSASPVARVLIFPFSREYAALKSAWGGGAEKAAKNRGVGDIDYPC